MRFPLIPRGQHLSTVHRQRILALFYDKQKSIQEVAKIVGTTNYTAKRIIRKTNAPTGKIRPSKVTLSVIHYIDTSIENHHGEVSASELKEEISSKFGISLSFTTIQILRRRLGWIKTGVKYCQLINRANVPVRFAWAVQA